MTCKSNWIPAAGIALGLLGISGMAAQAQTALLSYAAKFVCGERESDSSVVRGFYETSVNIHNPHFTRVVARKKAVLARPQSAAPGPVSQFVQEPLGPDRAVGVNCRDIRGLFDPPLVGFIEGFLVVHIPSATPLDVTDVITARQSSVESIMVYEVTPKNITPATPTE